MTDIHSHILFGVDDGSEDLAESLEMAEIAVQNGIREMIVTPHGNLEPEMDPKEYRENLRLLREALKEQGNPLVLYPGMEIYGSYDMIERLKEGKLFTLNDTKYVLIEYDFHAEAYEFDQLLGIALDAGYMPIVAHAERYRCVQRDPGTVYRWYEMGCGIQVNKGSITGSFGRVVQRTAMELINHRLVTAVATDAHGCYRRTPYMREAEDILSDYFGEMCPKLLTEDNPERIVNGEPLIWLDPQPF